MNIEIQRKYKKANYTIGSLSLPLGGDGEGSSFFCNTLEPPEGTEKESRTAGSNKAIPPGTYNIRLVWSPKFKQQLPLLYSPNNTPPIALGPLPTGESGERGFILIHSGNSARDTRGCILLGKNTRPGRVLQSREMLNAFINKLRTAQSKGEEVTIEIKD